MMGMIERLVHVLSTKPITERLKLLQSPLEIPFLGAYTRKWAFARDTTVRNMLHFVMSVCV